MAKKKTPPPPGRSALGGGKPSIPPGHRDIPFARMLDASMSALRLEQLRALGASMTSLATLAEAAAYGLARADARPRDRIGRRLSNPNGTSDYARDADSGQLVQTLNGRPITCGEQRLVDWHDIREISGYVCETLTGREIQRFINEAIKDGEEAAAALCTDPDCPDYVVRLLFQAWICMERPDDNGRPVTAFTVSLQFGLTCVPEGD